MVFSKIYLVPLLLFFVLIGGFIITYAIAIALKHARAFFPYISDTGTTSPESTIFAQVLNIGAVLIYITFYIRCKRVKLLYSDPKLPRYSIVARLNRISLWITLPIAIGTSMCGNFQETNAIIPHMIGAFLCFSVGMIYFWLHTIISYLTCPIMNTLNMARLRLLFTIAGSLFCSGTALFGIISFLDFKKPISELPKWGPDDGGYELHLISTFSEWITLIFYGLYVLTFIKEFKETVLLSPKIPFLGDNQVEKVNYTNSQTIDYGTNSVNINSLDNIDRKSDEDNNANFGKAANIDRGGSKILLV